MPRLLIALVLLPASAPLARGDDTFFPGKARRVLFLGDSITFAGSYIASVDAYLFTRFPDQKWELINLGLPSETASGLSEPDHPFPRPDVHERLARALEQTKPELVVVCYGMNDGIYHPPDRLRTRRYHEGIRKLYRAVHKAGARVTLMTPPPFDPGPIRAKVRPASAKEFSYKTPFAGYDEVLAGYAEWMLTLRGEGLRVVDVHTALRRGLAEARKEEPGYSFAGDGIHPNATGHGLIAAALLRGWDAPAEVDTAEIDGKGPTGARVVRGEVVTATSGDLVSLIWKTRIPMPTDPGWDAKALPPKQVTRDFNRHRLIFTDAKAERYTLSEGKTKLGTVTRKELAEGIDLTRFADLSTNRRAREVWPLAARRQRLLGRAWLSAVGHKRPGTPAGLSLEEAREKAAALEQKIRELAAPVKVHLHLKPAKP